MKVFNYMVLITTLALISAFAGIDNGLSDLLSKLGLSMVDGASTNSSFWTSALAVLVAVGGTGIVVGTLAKTSTENFLIVSFTAGSLTLGLQTFYGIINQVLNQSGANSWIFPIVMIIFGGLMVGFIVSLIEFFRGTD